MENHRKKNETEIQRKMRGHSSRIKQTEERILKLENEMVIKGKTEELLVKQLKTYERNMQELTDSIKRPNLRIIGQVLEFLRSLCPALAAGDLGA
jgi:hypothetical protein